MQEILLKIAAVLLLACAYAVVYLTLSKKSEINERWRGRGKQSDETD